MVAPVLMLGVGTFAFAQTMVLPALPAFEVRPAHDADVVELDPVDPVGVPHQLGGAHA